MILFFNRILLISLIFIAQQVSADEIVCVGIASNGTVIMGPFKVSIDVDGDDQPDVEASFLEGNN